MKANHLQIQLNEKVQSRYVYYVVDEYNSNFEQLRLITTGDVVPGESGRTQNNNPLFVNSMGEDYALYLKYSNFDFVNPTVGDKVNFNLRFFGGTKNIDVIFTNLGNGDWSIESDWLKEDSEAVGELYDEDEAIVTSAVNYVSSYFSKNENAVIGDTIVLPTDLNGANISWESADESIITISGQTGTINRGSGKEPKNTLLTAVIERNNINIELKFAVSIPKKLFPVTFSLID